MGTDGSDGGGGKKRSEKKGGHQRGGDSISSDDEEGDGDIKVVAAAAGSSPPHTLAPLLLARARQVVTELGAKPFAFWYDGKGKHVETHTFKTVWDEAGKIAYMLREEWGVPKGAMVVLCYGPGLHFFAAFLGCLRAGVVAVMVYPPAPPLSKSLPKMSKIVADCKPLLCLTDSKIAALRGVDRANPLSDSSKLWPTDLDFKATDGGLLRSFFSSSSSARSFDELCVTEEDLAFLQYTSGSTGDPKGVMVTFGALMANVYLMVGDNEHVVRRKRARTRKEEETKESTVPVDSQERQQTLREVSLQVAARREGLQVGTLPARGFSWLPQYHDMGLVVGFIGPFLTGQCMHYMSPVSFIKRPLLWLELISQHRVEWSVAPDFACALCARYMAKVRGTRKEPALDLSSLVSLISSAEPIRRETVERFEEAFRPHGLSDRWFASAYGLAEHVASACSIDSLYRSSSRPELTSVGSPSERADFMDIRIVHPDTMGEVSEAGATGEVWVSSPSVAAGYWGKPELSKEVFKAKLSVQGGAGGSDSLPPRQFLRTGDLGFVEEGLLYICGRIKDLIIFNGVNHYPQDVEFAVQEASDAVRQGCIAAFSSDETGGDGVLEVVFEIRQEREGEAQAVVEAAQAALSSSLGLRAAKVVAIKQKTIPKTTSGKIRRRATRQALHAGELHMVHELIEDSAAMSQDHPPVKLASMRSAPEERPRFIEGEVPVGKGGKEGSLAVCALESLSKEERVTIILEKVLVFAVEVRQNQDLTADDRFMEAGMTSVMMAELAVMLEDFLGSETREEGGDKDFEIGVEALFDYPTPTLLAAHIEVALFGEGEGDEGLSPSVAGEGAILSDGGGDIAVIGMACRFPGGCNSPQELWTKLCNEEDCVTDAPLERGLGAGVRGGFIDGVEAFDNAFFGMSIAEAEAQDPNQRIMLEVAYEALHRAGYEGRHRLEGHRVGVFVGAAGSDWSAVLRKGASGASPNAYTLAGASRACFAGRISHTLGLVGPCESVDAACSSSLVALTNACNNLRLRQCSSAVVGGVNLLLHDQGFGGLASAGLLSKEGHCKSFDVGGDGYVRSEGSGAVVLKLLCEAIKDEDNVLAVIKAAAVSHNGVSTSLSAPKGAAQQSLARSALRQAGCEGREVNYVEAHATGTVMSDAIELGALRAAFTPNRPEASPLVVGTVKTTLGHMEGASGMAQLIKAVLVMQHQVAPANLHLEEVNPNLKLEGVPVTLPTRRTPLSSYCSDGSTLLAAINSYAVGGFNAHVILRSYGDRRPEGAAERGDTPWRGFPSSRKFSLPKIATPLRGGVGPASALPPAGDALSQLRGTLSMLSPEDRHGTLLELLKAVVLKCVDADMPPLDDNVPLMEAGLDSMALEEVRNRLHTDLGVTATTDVLFEHPSIAALAGWLDGEVMGKGGTPGLARELSHTSTWPQSMRAPLAVVGMACRFPGGVTSPESFWRMLCTGLDCISTAPADRWGGGSKEWRGGFIEGIHLFDSTFFGISSAEAQSMDPNQRVLLEVAFEALHRAGYNKSSLRKSETGIFIGCAGSDWLQAKANRGAASESDGVYAASGASMSNLANRVSFALGLNGPSSTVDTACSSSLVALDSACSSLRLGKCDAAVVGGVNLLLSEAPFKLLSSGGFLSLDGRCKTFDKTADGYVRGEGCGVIVLKRLDASLADKDEVLAVLRGSAVNHNGASARMTAPNPGAQKQLIANALLDAGLSPNDVSVIEAHGTGTSLGDTIEMSALRGVFAHDRDETKPLIVGALKTNIGHLEGAAGIAGLIKAVLMAQHKAAPPNLHLTEQSPELDVEGFAVLLPSCVTPIPINSDGSVVLGISSFGFGGTNAHAVLSSLGPTMVEGSETLSQWKKKCSRENPPVVFLFTGQGSQYVGMGRELYEKEGVFRECVQRCSRLLMERAWLDKSVVELLYPAAAEEEEETPQALLKETRYCQPCLFVLEYALCELWKSEGVEPSMVMGHSLGEVVAACVAGVMSLEDGLMLSARRGAAMQACPEGEGVMFAVRSGKAATLASIDAAGGAGEVVLASSNGPSASVISGARSAVDKVVEKLTADGVGCKGLEVSHAFHSPLMQPAVRALEEALRQVSLSAPRIPLVSNVTGEVVRGEEVTKAAYWVQHMLSPVLFAESIHTLVEHWMGDEREAGLSIIEVGPNPVLSNMGAKWERREGLAWISSLTQGQSSGGSFAAALGSVTGPEHLELYPTRRSFPWYKPPLAFMPSGEVVQEGDAMRLASPFSPHLKDLLKDHAVNNTVIIPGVTYIEVGVVAALGGRQLGVEQQVVLQGASFVVPLEIEGFQQAGTDHAQSRHTMVCAGMSALHAADGSMHFFGGATGDEGTTARMKHVSVLERSTARTSLHVESIRARVGEHDVSSELYKSFADAGFQYGPRFQRTRHMYGGDGEVLSVVCALDEELCEPWEMKGFALHPAVLDNATHAIMQALPRKLLKEGGSSPFLPAGFDEMIVSAFMTGKNVWVHTKLSEVQSVADSAKFNVVIADFDSKEVLVEMRGFRVQRARGFVRVSPIRRAMYALEWQAAEPSTQEEARGSDTDPAEAAAPQKWLVVIPQDEREGETAIIAAVRRCVPENVHVHTRYGGVDVSGDDDALPLGEDEWARVLYVLIPGAGEEDAEGGQQARAAYALISLLRSLSTTSNVPLTVLTRGVESGEDWRHSWVAGLVRTARMEHPYMQIRVVDLSDKEASDSEVALGLAFPGTTEDVWVRDGQCWMPRLSRPALNLPFSLELRARGSIANAFLLRDDVDVAKHELLDPAGSIVEVAVRAVGLNFRDVLNVLGMYPGDPGDPCSEFAGEVIRVGGSSRFRVGDAVFGFADGGCLRSHMTTSDACLAVMPAVLSFEQAAALPTVCLTVVKAFHDLKAGEKVLIHAASGGVGLAAVQYAQRVGAEVYATAGAAVKHDFLRGLGVEHIASSRDAEAFKLSMGEVKVDVVLNSLSDDYIPFSLAMLSEGGTFVEIGKRGVWNHDQMRTARSDVMYELLALDSMIESDLSAGEPGWISGGLQRLADDCMSGNVKPLPTILFDMREDTQKAMVYMSQAKHIGKVVLTNPSYGVPVVSDGTYVISGGLGALGLVTAQHLASRGARHLVLLSRSGKVTESASGLPGAVLVSLPPVRGVVHAAGVQDDKILSEQTTESVVKVFRPKVQGAVNLHELSLGWSREEDRASSLDFFVCFTSMAGVLGNAGQANYAAANAAVDGLMRHRRHLGLTGTLLQWGPWADIGMAAQLDVVQKQSELAGVGMVSAELGMAALDAAVMSSASSASLGDVSILPGMDWAKYGKATRGGRVSMLEELVGDVKGHLEAGEGDSELHEELLDLTPVARQAMVVNKVKQVVEHCIGDEDDLIHDSTLLMEAGVDSLASVEIVNRLSAWIGCSLPPSILIEHPTPSDIARHILGLLFPLEDNRGVGVVIKADSSDAAAVREDERREGYSALDARDADEREDGDRALDGRDADYVGSSSSDIVSFCMGIVAMVYSSLLVAASALPAVIALDSIVLDKWGRWTALACVPLAFLSWALLLMAVVTLTKWVVIGRYRAGSYPINSGYYFRWLFVDRVTDFALQRLPLHGSVVWTWWLRALGAKIGHGCRLHSVSVSEFDLVHLGRQSTVEEFCRVRPAVIEDRHLLLRQITVGADCVLGASSQVFGGTTMGELVRLRPSTVVSGRCGLLAPCTEWGGSPAKQCDDNADRMGSSSLLPSVNDPAATLVKDVMRTVVGFALAAVCMAAASIPAYFFWGEMSKAWGLFTYVPQLGRYVPDYRSLDVGYLVAACAATFDLALVPLLPIALGFVDTLAPLKELTTEQYLAKPMLILALSYSVAGICMTAMSVALRRCLGALAAISSRSSGRGVTGQEVHAVDVMMRLVYPRYMVLHSGGPGMVIWLRSLGARVAWTAKVSAPSPVLDPALLDLGPHSVASGSFATRAQGYTGTVKIGACAVTAPGSCLCPGSELCDTSLVGPLTCASSSTSFDPTVRQRTLRSGDLVVRVKLHKRHGQQQEPRAGGGLARWAGAGTMLYSIVGPVAILLLQFTSVYVSTLLAQWLVTALGRWLALVTSPVIVLSLSMAMIVWAMVLKWGVVGRARAGCYAAVGGVTFHRDLFSTTFTQVARQSGVNGLAGTAAHSLWLRAMGAEVGKDAVVLATDGLSSFDLVHLGAGSVVDRDCVVDARRVVHVEGGRGLPARSDESTNCCSLLEKVLLGRKATAGADDSASTPFDYSVTGSVEEGRALPAHSEESTTCCVLFEKVQVGRRVTVGAGSIVAASASLPRACGVYPGTLIGPGLQQTDDVLLEGVPAVRMSRSAHSRNGADGEFEADLVGKREAPDLWADAYLPSEIAATTREMAWQASAGGVRLSTPVAESILLTGVTGFVGRYLLVDLLQAHPQSTVHCIVRALDDKDAMQRTLFGLKEANLTLRESERGRLMVYEGNITSPSLGLSKEVYQRLASTVTLVYHSAALLSYSKSYAQLFAPNVLGTLHVLSFAATNSLKTLHMVSTIAVLTPDMANEDGRMPADAPLGDMTAAPASGCALGKQLGYSQSKWVAEKLVMQAGQEGLDVSVYRVPLVAGHTSTGFAPPRGDVFTSMIGQASKHGEVVAHAINASIVRTGGLGSHYPMCVGGCCYLVRVSSSILSVGDSACRFTGLNYVFSM